MNEPNKGLLTHEKAQELVQRALDNRDSLAACKRHEFFQSLMGQAITSGTSAVLIAEGKLTAIPTPCIFKVSETEKPNEP